MGPLHGIKVIEIAGIGPGPFAAMMLADMGAQVIRVERPGGAMFGGDDVRLDFLNRSKRCACINLKHPDGVAAALKLIESADGLVEGNRPGVMERLGLGPEVCLARNPRLVYGRMTGWGQHGPLANAPGHDLNYIALTGALHAMGRAGEKPSIPLNLVGDFGGGGLLLAFGMVCALLEARSGGSGQVVDAAMIDGVSALMASVYSAVQHGFWSEERGSNLLDSGAAFYEVYETADGRYISVAAVEPQFYAALLKRLGLEDDPDFANQFDMARWPLLKEKLAEVFRTRTRDEWCQSLEGSDVCFAPVLAMGEARCHPHHVARGTFVDDGTTWQPRPAPRFSRSAPSDPVPAAELGRHTREILTEAGYDGAEIDELVATGAVAVAPAG